MSHFTVLVIGENPEKQLAPYQENNMGDCPEKYMEFNDVEEESKKEYLKGTVEKVVMPDGRYLSKWDKEFKKEGAIGSGSNTHSVPTELKTKEIPFVELYSTFEEYMKEWEGHDERDSKMNRYGYFENPNAKWDWYSLGGRWTGFFKLKTGTNGSVGRPGVMTSEAKIGHADQCLKKDIDFNFMFKDARKKALANYNKANIIINGESFKSWEDVRNMIKDIDEARKFYNNQPVVKRFNEDKVFGFWSKPSDFIIDKEKFLKNAEQDSISTFAILKDGKWIEKGEMGWWACVSNENNDWQEEYLKHFKELPEDSLLSVYDCHI